jgi:hypothetical protein
MLNNMNMASNLPAQVNRNRIRHTPQNRIHQTQKHLTGEA